MTAANLVEIENQEQLIAEWRKFGRVEQLNAVSACDQHLPIYGLTLGLLDLFRQLTLHHASWHNRETGRSA